MRALLLDANGKSLGEIQVPATRNTIRMSLSSLFRTTSGIGVELVGEKYSHDVVGLFRLEATTPAFLVYVLSSWSQF